MSYDDISVGIILTILFIPDQHQTFCRYTTAKCFTKKFVPYRIYSSCQDVQSRARSADGISMYFPSFITLREREHIKKNRSKYRRFTVICEGRWLSTLDPTNRFGIRCHGGNDFYNFQVSPSRW